MATTKSSGERVQQKGRTRSALLSAAVALVSAGSAPSVAEVADAANVSRRTAYRYFPTQEQLLVEASLEGVRGIISSAIEGNGTVGKAGKGDADIEARLDRVVHAMQQSAAENEQLLRSMIRLTVGTRPDPKRLKRGYRRIEWIAQALAPAKKELGKCRYERLVSALSLCMGIEALIILRDLRGLSGNDAENVSRWAARTLLRESLLEAAPKRTKK
ncbi:MAG: helix-turn-helix domain-containing protein [Gemmatimonadota bacterium]